MTTDIGTLLDFVGPVRQREIGARRGVTMLGPQDARKARLLQSFDGDVQPLLPLLLRAELVAFLEKQGVEPGGQLASINKASREQLERLTIGLCATKPRIDKPVDKLEVDAATGAEKIKRVTLQRRNDLMYYVKGGDIWSVPRPRSGKPRGNASCAVSLGLPMDRKYLYFVDGDGDVSRRRRLPIGESSDGTTDVAVAPKPPPPPPPVVASKEAPIRVFIAYARVDADYLREFRAALAPYERSRRLDVFVDGRIEAGQIWEAQIHDKLARAQIACLLLSNDFFASTYCMEQEVPRILAQQQRGECEVAPILIRPCRFDLTVFEQIQVIRPGDKPVGDQNRDSAWEFVTRELDRVIARVRRATR